MSAADDRSSAPDDLSSLEIKSKVSKQDAADELDELYLFPHLQQTDRPDPAVDILAGERSVSPNVGDSRQPLNTEGVFTEPNTAEKRISPICWDRNSEKDSVRVDAPENEFSKEAEEEQSQKNSVHSESVSENNGGVSAEIMDPDILTDYDQLFINTKYFLIKSNNYENVEIAKKKNAWSTPIGNESRLNRAYYDSNNVILIFSVRESGKFQGFARLASPSDPRLHIDWVLPSSRMSVNVLSSPFRLDWVTKQELPFTSVSHLTNSWNDGKQVKIGRDGQEIEPVCGQALCRHFPLDSMESIPAIVRKIEPKKPKLNDLSRRRNVTDRLGASQSHIPSSSRRSKDLGFNNPNSIGLLGAATTSSRPTIPPLMSSLNLATAAMSTVAAMAAMKSNQSRGSLLPTTDISRFITPNANILSHLLPQAVGTESVTLSALYSSHAPAINRIFQQDGVSPKRQRSRERHRSPSSHYSSAGHRSDSDYRRSRYDRRDYRQSDESSCRYRSRRRSFVGRRMSRRSRDRSISPSRASAFIHWNYEDYLQEVRRGLNPNLNSLINGNIQHRQQTASDADRQFNESVDAFLRNTITKSSSQRSNDGYGDYEEESRSRSSSIERHHRRRCDRRSRQRSYEDSRRYGGDEDGRDGRSYYSRRRGRSRSRFYYDDGEGDDYRERIDRMSNSGCVYRFSAYPGGGVRSEIWLDGATFALMEFVKSSPFRRLIPRVQFYSEPPTHTIELEQLEQLATERLKVLRCIEAVGQDLIRGSKDYDQRLATELPKLGLLGKSFTLTSSQLKNIAEDIHRDVTSHFILQIAYCRSDSMRRWFIQQESDLLRYRFNLERTSSGHDSEAVREFLHVNNLHFSTISPDESLRLRDQLRAGTVIYGVNADCATFYRVHFTEVLDLVRRRQVFLKVGYAYVPDVELVTLVVTRFRASLSRSLSRLDLALVSRLADEGTRLLPLLTSISKRYLGEDDFGTKSAFGAVSCSQVNELARVPGLFPPCMSRLHEALVANHHLRHWGRMQYGLFLKGIGLSVDEALKFWRNSFAPRVDSDQFAKQYSYSIRHNYGKEGKRADYTPYSCMKIISFSQPGTGEFHGCPFRHLDLDLLSQRLAFGGRVSSDQVEAVVKRAKDNQYQQACREFFKILHPDLSPEDAASVVIIHPNQYYEMARKADRGIPLSSSGESGTASQRASGTKWCAMKVPLNDSRLASQGRSVLGNSNNDDESSDIDSARILK
ncbi:unnamed protein product [Hydatigera taeniaeformis]|uniref:DNA primase large subunit n=1 Tax=Hydatigena taeniaeformis TaxID=6205 RepID=A0A158RDH6_HYDTA|nr:unnamed protein product [Hydatigera taeniaeformis]